MKYAAGTLPKKIFRIIQKTIDMEYYAMYNIV